MSNALGIGPSVMINRIVDDAGTPLAAQLAKVAEPGLKMMTALDNEQAEAAAQSADGNAPPPALDSGATVDRLV